MIMRWCNVQTNEYDLQAITYPTICTHHKLYNNDGNKIPFSRNVYAIRDKIWCNNHLRHMTTEKYDNNGKGWYFRFDNDNNMSYNIVEITRANSRFAPSQLKTLLLWNNVSHWMGTKLHSALNNSTKPQFNSLSKEWRSLAFFRIQIDYQIFSKAWSAIFEIWKSYKWCSWVS